MKDDNEKIRGTVKKLNEMYNFRGPLHFTDFSNLNSIISIGFLCSRELCYANNIEFLDAAVEENINDTKKKANGYTRFYFVEKNNYDIMKQLNIPVYLLFNEETIYLDLAIYSDGNADSCNTDYGTDYDFFNYDIDWEVTFNNKKQAELLIDEPVPLYYLKNIIFRCNADYKRACNLFGKNRLYLIEPDMFFNGKNYITDYNIVYNSLSDKDVFILHFSSKEPVINDDRHEYRLYDLNDKLIRIANVSFLESESTNFHVEVSELPCLPIKFKFWFYGILSIEEIIG